MPTAPSPIQAIWMSAAPALNSKVRPESTSAAASVLSAV